MNHSKMKWTLLVLTLAVLILTGGCHKKTVPSGPKETAAPPPPESQPTATLSVSPDSIHPGESTTLSWSSQHSTATNIDGIGPVPASGSQQVSPQSSTTYHMTAQGPGGTAEASARVTVAEAAPPAPQPMPEERPKAETPNQTDAELFAKNMKDIFFDYDKYDLRPDDQATVSADLAFLKDHPTFRFTIEGHCDERGSTEYNLALGDNRANAARDALVKAGLPANRIRTVSYGKERPFCSESNENCWQQNRRAHFVLGQ